MDKFDREFFGFAIGMWIVMIVLGLAFWGGLIWFVFFLLNKYGVI